MTNVHDHEFLSFGDALFLYLERDETPLNIASVAMFDGPISMRDFTRCVESKLPLIPRYMQRVVFPALHLGLPWWEFDQTFDIRNHVRAAKLKHGTEAELKALASKMFSETMDRRRPLWDLTLVPGLQEGRTGLIARIHHSLADGLSGVGVLNALFDASRDVVPLPRKKLKIPEAAPRDPATSLIDGVLASFSDSVQRIVGAHTEVLRMAERLVTGPTPAESEPHGLSVNNNDAMPSVEEVGRLLPELLAPTEKMPFNTLCKGPQKFDWTSIPFAEVRAIKHACGVTVNDVLLAIVGSAFRHYARAHDIDVKTRDLRIIVPVSTRGRNNVDQLGNQITFVPVNVPLGFSAPQKTIAAVHERTRLIKGARVPEFVAFGGSLMGTIPAPLQVFVSNILTRLPLSLCNIICTNVPGPKTPLYMLGRKMISCYPYVPIGGEMGVNCAVLTYDGNAYFGFSGDQHAIPDLEKLPAFVNKSFEEMRKAVGLHPPVKKRVRRKSQPTPAVQPAVQAMPTPQSVATMAANATTEEQQHEEQRPVAMAVAV